MCTVSKTHTKQSNSNSILICIYSKKKSHHQKNPCSSFSLWLRHAQLLRFLYLLFSISLPLSLFVPIYPPFSSYSLHVYSFCFSFSSAWQSLHLAAAVCSSLSLSFTRLVHNRRATMLSNRTIPYYF